MPKIKIFFYHEEVSGIIILYLITKLIFVKANIIKIYIDVMMNFRKKLHVFKISFEGIILHKFPN